MAFAGSVVLVGMSHGAEPALPATERSISVLEIADPGVLILGEDRQVCLGGVWLGGVSPSALQMAGLKQAMIELIGAQPVRIDEKFPPVFDRYGCELAKVVTANGVSLQRALLMQGLAMVRPSLAASSFSDLEAWLVLEEEARQAKLGIWRDQSSWPKKASAMDEHIGKTSLVEGRVIRVFENDRYVYLNFGKDWRSDFTVRLRQKLLKRNSLQPDHFDGKRLRIRGFVQEARGPLIHISHLKQIEIIP